jgi:hypothetical protein
MAAQLRESEGTGISQALKEGLNSNNHHHHHTALAPEAGKGNGKGEREGTEREKLVLRNRAGESRSPYVQGHARNPVAWQLWGEEAVALARRENRLVFLSIGYSACHCEF